ncbi:MAG: hypothetical protein KKC39_07980 [Candidatus Omnitrophica bacterium]|nr:hypothetical protein [Candidatus Omnitrophota bacterium]MBU4303326.1 hypothetical protein [Candidatus Omnitrophota bacterium]MBU4418844.1 hypothetical protein [Candidatus Omnitrophota bacterium]MBU4468656.1 hypothetical protein [Candidatus Omnitrophota bacterium]MCG2707546.1 hypothetical protein [Candidatus Omnitrophota bacterium]
MALKNKKKIKKSTKKLTKKTVKKAVKKSTKKLIKKKPNKKTPVSKKNPAIKKAAKVEGKLIGLITHYFPHVQAAVIKLKAPLAKGDTVKIKGHTTDITQVVTSLQMDRVAISTGKKGDEIGLQVTSRVRQQDKVYKI